MTKSERIAQQKRLHNRYAKQFRAGVHRALKGQYDEYTSSLHSHGAQYVLSHPKAHLINPALTATITRLYVTCAIGRATLTFRELQRLPRVEKKTGSMGFNAQWTNDVLNYFRLHLFDKVVLPISETTQDYIHRTLRHGIAEGWSIDRMVLEIERKDYLDGRVERILRTEINRAINYGNEIAAGSYQFKTKKVWIAVDDSRTRPSHHAADGQTVDIDDKFTVGGENMDFPGDPEASGDNTINCRCVTSIEPVRDSRGRLESTRPEPATGRIRQGILDAIDALND